MNFRFEIFVGVSPGDLSGDAPKIRRSGIRTVCRVRDESSLPNFLYVFLLGIFQATRPRSSGRELVQCAAFAMNFRFEIFVCVSPGDLSGDAPKILRAGTRTVCRVRDEFSLWIF